MYRELRKRLNSPFWEIRKAARQEATWLSPDSLFTIALMEAQVHRKRDNAKRLGWKIIFCLWIFGLFFKSWTESIGKNELWIVQLILMGLTGGIIYGIIINTLASLFVLPRRALIEILSILMQTEDVRFVGPALTMISGKSSSQLGLRRMFSDSSGAMETNIQALLKRLLPKVDEVEARNFTMDQKTALTVPLKEPHFDEELTLSVLNVLERFGGSEATPAVRYALKQAKNGSVRTAARQCLSALENRTTSVLTPDLLLRPATAPDAPTSVLLRQAGTGQTAEEMLVRPAESEKNPIAH